MTLTGNTRHRLSSFGKKLILQVAVSRYMDRDMGGSGYFERDIWVEWRDATVEDLQLLELHSKTK